MTPVWPAVWPAEVDLEVDAYASSFTTVFASFLLQDSGCRAHGVVVDGERWFLKGSVEARAVPSLERAVVIHARVTHPAVIPLHASIRTPTGLVLVYPWVDGEVLSGPPVADPLVEGRSARLVPGSAHERFRSLALEEVLAAFGAILDAHLAIVAAGFVAVDLYDGCFVYDFSGRHMWLCDLDEYRPGPFVVEDERLPGSTRFMAPEEWVRGATVDERTTVFNLGRTAMVLLDERGEEREVGEAFRGTAAMAAVLECATCADPRDRYPTVKELAMSWQRAVEDLR